MDKLFVLLFLVTSVSDCFVLSRKDRYNNGENTNFLGSASKNANMARHILQQPDFWKSFAQEVLERKSWKCSFPKDVLTRNLEDDAKLYEDDTIMKRRRKAAESWIKNDTLWSIAILGACKELANDQIGIFVKELQKFKVVEALRDYVEHLHCFYTVAQLMDIQECPVVVHGQNLSPIHDIDKLDPVMLVSYSERFEDNKTTSLWNLCVDRHTHINTHHQAHCLWQNCCHIPNTKICTDAGDTALPEMVCDKVSRRMQKNFNSHVNEKMWDVELSFYNGLPKTWLDKAVTIMHDMKCWERTNKTAAAVMM